jgi:hypothetical protein
MKQIYSELTKSDIAERLLRLHGSPYSLNDYLMFRGIFNTPYEKCVMRAGRQVSKTITMAADMVLEAVLTPYNSLIYVNASGSQTTAFSTSKLDPFLIHSPIVYTNLMKSKHCINNVFNKRFANFSEIKLSYFSESADRIRGSSGTRLYVDEVQDILHDAIIDSEECLSAAKNPTVVYAGTSKTMITSLEYYWELSTQKRWVIKCTHCGKYNIPTKENIDRIGLVCKNCKSLLDTYSGFWHPTCTGTPEDKSCDGYSIPQIIMPMHCTNREKWLRLFEKYENYPTARFDNEVMGEPTGEGTQLITESMIIGMCIPTLKMLDYPAQENVRGAAYIVAGIDWGGSGIDGVSRTTISIYAVYPGVPEMIKIFCKVYSAGEPSQHVQDIAAICRTFDVTAIYGDHGNGNFALSQLHAMLPDKQVVPVMYTEQSAPFRWDQHGAKFIVNRTIMIDSFLFDIKAKKIKCFRYEDFKPFSQDLLNVKEVFLNASSGTTRRAWRHHPKKSDDVLHSMVFGWFGARVLMGDLNFTVDGAVTDTSMAMDYM